jgi:hypothetical protein
VSRGALHRYHTEDESHDGHRLHVHVVAVPTLVESETEVGSVSRNYLALAGLPQLASPAPLSYFGPLVLGQLVEDAIRQLRSVECNEMVALPDYTFEILRA